MFGKLMKHEWRRNRALVGMFCALTAGSGLLAGASLRYMTWFVANGNDAAASGYGFLLTLAAISFLGCCFLPMYLFAYRFYKSRFSDQGYLMLTLPVTTHQQLLSSIFTILISIVLITLTAVVSVALGLGFFISMFDPSSAAEIWANLKDGFSGLWIALQVSETELGIQLPVVPIAFVADLVLIMLALTVGAQVREHPLMKGASVYILTDFAVSEGCAWIAKHLDNRALSAGISCVIYGALAVAAYLIMYRIFEKRLNLT